ncbi:hypothetical protein C5167_040432 [Papaver somniferum]|uniref:SANT domain-containing protein n=1 Tax=Papaver somniferum TaxID=3469 RepID=A0A4Y7IF43_PAPSO|nr:uncharacterized protein LOC113316216 [Papaver somniferum]XP_026420225.1 uncharacterized protein LOC113316216 [Papaver somniferum]RZC47494.1 hypothetical protein C5167_040432 [Papaver somniferum]
MDSEKEDSQGDSLSEETSSSQSRGSCEPDVKDICGKQQKIPRIGDEYQVGILPDVVEVEPLMKSGMSDAGIMVNVADSFVEPLPILIIWTNNDIGRRPDTDGSLNFKNVKPVRRSSNKEVVKIKEVKNEDEVYFAAPGCLGNSWTDLEKEAFLLGLYIFGKNLVKVKKFVESKGMGDILSFYYGEFYRSAAHRRWSSSRNKDKRSRRCIQGTKMFKTWRQHKFLSCLLPRIPEQSYSTLVEVSKNYEASNVSLEDYVSTLKATVGVEMLVEVFGIGKGKQDLTALLSNPSRNNQQVVPHPEIPVGKGWSTLTYDEIVGFLTGDYRLSKARSLDLFWEAVWPRLLARGWESKQPKNQIGTNSKNPLVFMVPGVKKFSRKKLVKGEKYFDSVTDVLSKVASDPKLMELEDEAGKGNISTQENDWDDKKMKHDSGGDSDHKRRSYLQPQPQPQPLESNSDPMKFTVIDTSMGDDEDSFPVRKLRSLPIETTETSSSASLKLRSLPVETTETSSSASLSTHNENGSTELANENGSKELANGSGSKGLANEKSAVDMSLNCTRNTSTSRSSEGMTDKDVRAGSLKFIITVSKKEMQIKSPVRADVSLHNDIDQSTCNPDMDSKKPIKCQFSRRKKPSQSNCVSPVIKRRRLTACSEAKEICSKDSSSSTRGLKEEDCHLRLGSSNARDNLVSEVMEFQENVCSSSSGKGSPDENHFGKYISQKEKYPPRISIDLNLPHVPSNVEIDEPFIKEVEISQRNPSSEHPPSAASGELAGAGQQPSDLASRRQGTRKRPLTTKALEALACGFLTTKRKPR